MIKRRTELKWICSLNCEPEVYIVRRGIPPTHKKIQLRNKRIIYCDILASQNRSPIVLWDAKLLFEPTRNSCVHKIG